VQRREAALAEAYAAAQAQRATASLTMPCPDPAQHAKDGLGIAVPTGQDALTSVVTTVGTAAGVALAEALAGPLVYFLSSAAQSVSAKRGGQLHEQLAQFLHEWANTMERRKLLRLLGWTAVSAVASPVVGNLDQSLNLNTDEQERVVGAIASPSRVDVQVIDHIEAVFRHCQQQEDALGPQVVLQTVLAERQMVDALLADCPAPLRSRLLSVHSRMSSSVGFYFFDLGDAASAMHYCDQARANAQEARNTELAIYALCNTSYFASWQGKVHTAIDFAGAAQSLADKTDDVLLQVCAAERAGTAYAVDGQYKECMAAFERAQVELESSADEVCPESPAYWYHEGLVASQQSDCLLRLGKPQEAVSKASAGLRLFDTSFVGSRAFCTLRLGTAYLQSDEVEEAAQVIGDGALLATQNRSTRLTGEVQTARACLQPWQGTQAVKTLDERLREIGLG